MKTFLTSLLLLLLFLSPSLASAHGDEVHLNITVNNKRTIPNEITQNIKSDKFLLTEDIAPEEYLINQEIEFAVQHGESEPHGEYSWTFSDGQGVEGDIIKKAFTKPGSYVITLEKDAVGEPIKHTILIHIIPSESYHLPNAKPTINSASIPTSEAFEVDLNKPITLTAESDSNGEITYLWNFDNGDVLEGKTIEYEYSDQPFLATPILRVIDRNGIYTDTQVSLKNTQFQTKSLPILPIMGGILLIIFLSGIGGLVIRRKPKK